MKVTQHYERRVYYYETDKMGIMHHSNYIRIFEETRIFFLECAGMSFEKIEEKGLMMPVVSVECEYRKPLQFNDPFEVYPVITRFNGTTLYVSYTVINKRTGEVSATGKSSHCFTDASLRPVRTKKAYPDVYEVFAENLVTDGGTVSR